MSDFYDYLDKVGITPNAFHVLWCIANSRRPSLVNPWPESRLLRLSELVDVNHVLTDKGKEILAEGEAILCNGSTPKKKPKVVIDDLEANVVKYLELFPAGKLPTGKTARVNKNDIIKAFMWFFANYTYSWDTILKATAHYVDTYEKQKFMYMKTSQYFIRKQITGATFESDLANYCEIIINGGYDDSGNQILDKVV